MPRAEQGGRIGAPWHPAHLLPVSVAATAGLVLVVLTQRHGLDWSDESFVWAMIASDRVAVGEAWGFQHLLHPVWGAVGESVLVMRLLRVVGYLVVSVLLTPTAVRVLRVAGVELRRRESWFVLLVAQAGTLLAWSYPPRYLGYNELSAWLSALVCAALAAGLVPRGRDASSVLGGWAGRAGLAMPWTVAGALVALLVVAKFTAGVAWAVLVLVTLLLPVPGSRRWVRLLAVVGGAALGVASMLVAGVPVLTVVRGASGLLLDGPAQAESDHAVSEILGTYLTSTLVTARALVVPLLLLVALMLLGARRGRSTAGAVLGVGLAVGLAVAFVAVLMPAAVAGEWEGLGVIGTACGLGGALMLLLAVRDTFPVGAPVLRLTAVLLLALGAPLVAAVGTNNAIWSHTTFSATPWAVLLGVGLCLLARVAGPPVRVAPLLLGGLVVAPTTTAVYTDVTAHPYRSSDYLAQMTPTSVPQLDGILLSEDQAGTADWLHSVAEREGAAGVPAVALASPGYLFVFSSSGWASPWRGGSWQASVVDACERDKPEDLFVLEPAEPAAAVARERARLQQALTTCGLAFPDDFRVVAERGGSVVWRLSDRL